MDRKHNVHFSFVQINFFGMLRRIEAERVRGLPFLPEKAERKKKINKKKMNIIFLENTSDSLAIQFRKDSV